MGHLQHLPQGQYLLTHQPRASAVIIFTANLDDMQDKQVGQHLVALPGCVPFKALCYHSLLLPVFDMCTLSRKVPMFDDCLSGNLLHPAWLFNRGTCCMTRTMSIDKLVTLYDTQLEFPDLVA